jgi:hypothetical protein
MTDNAVTTAVPPPDFQKAVLRKRWATLEELMSAGERKQRIIADIIEDFSLKPRLNNDRGTAILVAASIYDACHYFRLLQNTSFGPYCGLITSYEPVATAISKEPPISDREQLAGYVTITPIDCCSLTRHENHQPLRSSLMLRPSQ